MKKYVWLRAISYLSVIDRHRLRSDVLNDGSYCSGAPWGAQAILAVMTWYWLIDWVADEHFHGLSALQDLGSHFHLDAALYLTRHVGSGHAAFTGGEPTRPGLCDASIIRIYIYIYATCGRPARSATPQTHEHTRTIANIRHKHSNKRARAYTSACWWVLQLHGCARGGAHSLRTLAPWGTY